MWAPEAWWGRRGSLAPCTDPLCPPAPVPPVGIVMKHHRPETFVEPKFLESPLRGASHSLGPLNRKRRALVQLTRRDQST